MSPIAARIASRAVQRRSISMMTGARRWAQGFEPHPFERIPVTTNPQRADFSKMMKRSAGGLVFFVPSICVLLGWPYIGFQALNGHIH